MKPSSSQIITFLVAFLVGIAVATLYIHNAESQRKDRPGVVQAIDLKSAN